MAAAAAHYAARRLDEAERCCEEVLARQPDHFDALHLLGVIRTESGNPVNAYGPLLRATELAPENARAHYHLGNAYLALDRFADAENSYRRALARDPELLEARNNLGNALRRQGRETAALDSYRAVLARRPGFAPALYNMGLALAALGEFAAAIDCYRTVLAHPPGPGEAARFADVREALAAALVETGRHDLAVDTCRAWQALAPGAWRAEWNAALSLLALGRYAEAWPLYERRWELPEARAGRVSDAPPVVPAWADLAGKRVLLRGEQGRGDVIQFARYAPLLARHAAAVTLVVYPELTALLGRMPGVAGAIHAVEPEPEHDLTVSLASLPLVFGTTLETIPATVPYLTPKPEAVARWRARFDALPTAHPTGLPTVLPTGPHVGLCWWGSPHSRKSSILLPLLEPLLRLPGAHFHAVQQDMDPTHRTWLATHTRAIDHSEALTDFDATAALIAALDLVITIDTSVAHLAGALGRPTWVMLRYSCDWRWLRHQTSSPWYPTARLFRQGTDRQWEPVIAAVIAALAGIARPME
ncbi:MAG: tetratricopeptide repeat protein [Acetobacteraceae bacterium]